jgi:hypothetical protein
MLQPSNTNLHNVLKQNSSVRVDSGCYVEYNMNMLTNLTSSSITGPAYKTFDNGRQPFKKLFPIETIIKPFRPNGAGIKYAIFGDMTSGDYRNPTSIDYNLNYRYYYPGLDTYYKYWVSNIGEGGTIAITYPKTIIANKIVLKFEISHATPGTWTIYGTPAGGSEVTLLSGTSSDIPAFGSGVYNAGVLTIYYTGSAWTTNASLHNPDAYVSLTSIKTTFAGVSSKFIGVIEFAPIWVKDISSNVVDFSISKTSSSTSEGQLPIGMVTANSLSLNINSYNSTSMDILNYDRDNSFTFNANKIYMYKQIQLKPYFKIYHSNGAYGSGSDKYDRIDQGIFYVDSWETSEFNDVSITALDAAKILQETIPPTILCENYSATAIFRRLLDNIGFTSYKFNTISNDQSIISPNYWWSDDNKTVWQCIQELCTDTQMLATVDENGILQFYSRDYLYTTRSDVWEFTSETHNGILPNIVSLNKKDVASANQVVVRWRSAVTSNYERNSDIIWKSDPTLLTAAGLVLDLNSTDVSTYDSNGNATLSKYVYLEPITSNLYENQQALYSFNGYLVIEDEIIEYDAIQYQYNALDNSGINIVDIKSASDLFKYRGLAKVGSENFKPTGAYRIKTRGAFGTGPVSGNPGYPHRAGTDAQLNSWTVKEVVFKN